MYPPRRMWRGPQEEHRTVSVETEVKIPNLEALSICAFSALSTVGLLWWGRMWKVWFPPLLLSIIVFLIMLRERITLPRLGLGIPNILQREFKSCFVKTVWKVLCFLMNSIVLPVINWGAPPAIVGAITFWGLREVLLYWYGEVAFWTDILMGLWTGLSAGAAAVIYFHWNNVRNPAWPPPYWYISGELDEDELPDYDERSGYSRRIEGGQ